MVRLKPRDKGDLYPAATLTMGLMATIISDCLTVSSNVGEFSLPTDFFCLTKLSLINLWS